LSTREKLEMHTVEEIKQAILQLCAAERERIATWLDSDADSSYTAAEPATAYANSPVSPLLTADEYLEFEHTCDVRHEFVAGTLYAMADPSKSHNLIAGNLIATFHGHVRGGPCNAYVSAIKLRLKVGHDDLFYYPDVMVACEREDASEYYLQLPKLIIEVLSPSTEKIDRREKALNYRQIATLEEYVLVAQNRPHVEIQRRADNWQPTVVTSLDATAEFHSIGLSMPLTQIYEDTHVSASAIKTQAK
jgi:Uma2 family endonuclease